MFLDGVNFSRTWVLNRSIKGMPVYSHFKNMANEYINYSLPNVAGDSYEDDHWLASCAIYALSLMNYQKFFQIKLKEQPI